MAPPFLTVTRTEWPEDPAASSFDASPSKDSDETTTGYAWEFGDGATATGKTISHTYPARVTTASG
ncbi:PKD domain-containing protein [Amycolatopsis azurea]|nr:PKD domain-containing protein [Amycolatopsis azurea]